LGELIGLSGVGSGRRGGKKLERKGKMKEVHDGTPRDLLKGEQSISRGDKKSEEKACQATLKKGGRLGADGEHIVSWSQGNSRVE